MSGPHDDDQPFEVYNTQPNQHHEIEAMIDNKNRHSCETFHAPSMLDLNSNREETRPTESKKMLEAEYSTSFLSK